jgi:hypothetical protein
VNDKNPEMGAAIAAAQDDPVDPAWLISID